MTSQVMNGVKLFETRKSWLSQRKPEYVTVACTKGLIEEILNVVYASEELHEHVL